MVGRGGGVGMWVGGWGVGREVRFNKSVVEGDRLELLKSQLIETAIVLSGDGCH